MTRLTFPADWRTVDGVFGGYVVARLLAAGSRVEGFEPLSVSVQFQGGVRPGACDLPVVVVHRGALTAVVEVQLVQEHRRATAVLKLGRGSSERIIHRDAPMLGVPAPETLPACPLPHGRFPYDDHLDIRLLADSDPPRSQRLRSWVRLDKTSMHLPLAAAACLLLDTAPPGPFFTDPVPLFVPTVDFTAHFAPAVPWDAAQWAFLVRETSWATRDFCVEEASLFTRGGSLIAQARQARRVRLPEE